MFASVNQNGFAMVNIADFLLTYGNGYSMIAIVNLLPLELTLANQRSLLCKIGW